MMMCRARRLNPFEGDAFLIGYDGREGPQFSLITAHQAFLKRAEVNEHYDGMQSGLIVKNQDGAVVEIEGDFYDETQTVLGGWAKVHLKNRTHPVYRRIRLKRFQKNFGVWLDDSAGMIVKCAEADGMRSAFPTVLGGLYLREEVEKEPTMRVATPLFKEKEPKDAVVETTAEMKEDKVDVDGLASIQQLCKIDKIDDRHLIVFLNEIGVADNIKDLSELKPDVLTMVLEQWPDIVSKIREQEFTPSPFEKA